MDVVESRTAEQDGTDPVGMKGSQHAFVQGVVKLAVFSAKSYDRTYFDQVREQHFPELCTIEYHAIRGFQGLHIEV
jgi:hypothetical protein